MLYQFAHEINANIIVSILNIEVFTMHEYVDIIVDVLLSKINYLLNMFLYLMVCIYLGSWMDFWMNVTYSMFVMPLMGHMFHFPKNKISRLLYYLQNYYFIWKSYDLIVLQTICDMDKLLVHKLANLFLIHVSHHPCVKESSTNWTFIYIFKMIYVWEIVCVWKHNGIVWKKHEKNGLHERMWKLSKQNFMLKNFEFSLWIKYWERSKKWGATSHASGLSYWISKKDWNFGELMRIEVYIINKLIEENPKGRRWNNPIT